MHCSLCLEEFSVAFFFPEKNQLSESRIGVIRMISSVGHHRGEEWKQSFVDCLSH